MNGFIVLHRKMLEWEWYGDVNVRALFFHCLLKANWKDKKWRGVEVPRGSFITSYDNLAEETGLSVRSVRTALDKLKSTNELSVKTTSQFSMISITNYSKYQDEDTQNDKRPTNDRQTSDKPPTTTEQDNNKTKKQKEDTAAEFEAEFWPAAIKKKSKDDASKAYTKARARASREEIIPAWKAMNAYWSKLKETKDFQFVPYPASWLNDGAWTDDLPLGSRPVNQSKQEENLRIAMEAIGGI